LWRLNRLDEATAAVGRAATIYEERAEEMMQDATTVRVSQIAADCLRIGAFFGSIGQRSHGLKLIRKSAALHKLPLDPTIAANELYYHALAHARVGDAAGYRESCAALMSLPLDELSGPVRSRPIWTPCLAPEALDDPTLPIELAKKFLANAPNERQFALLLLGAAHYRAGQYEEAASKLEESVAADVGEARGTDSSSYHRLFLAMTRWQLGQQDQARRLLAETLPAIDQEFRVPTGGWNRRATLELLRSEAEALIKPADGLKTEEDDRGGSDQPASDHPSSATTGV
jgi:tetratricopeptide (TPR) repeat protein